MSITNAVLENLSQNTITFLRRKNIKFLEFCAAKNFGSDVCQYWSCLLYNPFILCIKLNFVSVTIKLSIFLYLLLLRIGITLKTLIPNYIHIPYMGYCEDDIFSWLLAAHMRTTHTHPHTQIVKLICGKSIEL